MRNWIIASALGLAAWPVWAQDPAADFLKGVSALSAAECHALADRIPGMQDTGATDEGLRLLSGSVREVCFLTGQLEARGDAQTSTGVTRGQTLDADLQARKRASENLLRSAMAADSGVQNDLLRRLLGQDPVPKG